MYHKSWHKCTKNHDTSVPKIMIICYSSWDKVCDDVIVVFILGYFLPFCPPNSSKNQDFVKLKKAPEDIIILHMCLKNYDKMLFGSWDMVRNRRTDGQTDGRTEKVTYWMSHLKIFVLLKAEKKRDIFFNIAFWILHHFEKF